MLISAQCVTPPSLRCVTVAQVKEAARIDADDDDDFLVGCIAAAEGVISSLCRRALMPQTWRGYYSGVQIGQPEELPCSPASSIVVSYRDTAATWATVTANTFADGNPGRWYPPYLQTAIMMDGSPAWKVECAAGYASADLIPAPLLQAVKMFAGHLYDKGREIVAMGVNATEIPKTLDYLIAPYIAPTGGGI